VEEDAFHQLKQALYSEPFGVHVDASKYAVGACLMQWNEDGTEIPISFASSKLTGSQLSWAAIEKEAYAVVLAHNKFRTWCFGVPIVIYSDSNPLTYFTSKPLKVQNLLVGHLLCKNIIIHSNIGEGLSILSLISCYDHAGK